MSRFDFSYSVWKNGQLNDPVAFEEIISQVFFNELRVEPEEIDGVILTQSWRESKMNKEWLTSLFFDQFKVKKFYMAKESCMTAYAYGRSTALVIDSGASTTSVNPIYEDFSVPGTQ